MKTRVLIRLETGDPRLARAVCAGLEPDNIDFPEGLSMEMRRRNGSVLITFESNSVTDTLISTVDDVFEACGVSLQGIRSAKER